MEDFGIFCGHLVFLRPFGASNSLYFWFAVPRKIRQPLDLQSSCLKFFFPARHSNEGRKRELLLSDFVISINPTNNFAFKTAPRRVARFFLAKHTKMET
jgi:hypothetical protein